MVNKTLIIFAIGILLVISLALFVSAGAFANYVIKMKGGKVF
jgi:hypothetical protein